MSHSNEEDLTEEMVEQKDAVEPVNTMIAREVIRLGSLYARSDSESEKLDLNTAITLLNHAAIQQNDPLAKRLFNIARRAIRK